MMRSLTAAALVLALALPAAAGPKPDRTNWFLGPFAPHLNAFDMDERGLSRYPFDPSEDYLNGAGWAVWARGAHQLTEGSREATHASLGMRTQERFGFDFNWSWYEGGAFNIRHRSELLSAHLMADLSQSDRDTLEYGVGFVTLQGGKAYTGPSLALNWERRWAKPWTSYARYAPSLVSGGRVFHQLTAGFGPSWNRLGLELGYRALLNPLRNTYGPEAALRLWF